jgi:hypothetical protein
MHSMFEMHRLVHYGKVFKRADEELVFQRDTLPPYCLTLDMEARISSLLVVGT